MRGPPKRLAEVSTTESDVNKTALCELAVIDNATACRAGDSPSPDPQRNVASPISSWSSQTDLGLTYPNHGRISAQPQRDESNG